MDGAQISKDRTQTPMDEAQISVDWAQTVVYGAHTPSFYIPYNSLFMNYSVTGSYIV
jgi:hypothetical protein